MRVVLYLFYRYLVERDDEQRRRLRRVQASTEDGMIEVKTNSVKYTSGLLMITRRKKSLIWSILMCPYDNGLRVKDHGTK